MLYFVAATSHDIGIKNYSKSISLSIIFPMRHLHFHGLILRLTTPFPMQSSAKMSLGAASSSQSEFSARSWTTTKNLQFASQLGEMMFKHGACPNELTNLAQIVTEDEVTPLKSNGASI